MTGGPVALALLAMALVGLGPPLWRVLQRGNRTEDRAASLAVVGALVSVGIHEAVDFGLTLVANGVTLAILVGATASARIRRRKTAA